MRKLYGFIICLSASVLLLIWWHTHSNVEYMLRQASIQDRAGKTDEAIELLLRVIERDPTRIVAHVNLGALYFAKVAYEAPLHQNKLFIDEMLDEHELALKYAMRHGADGASNICDTAYWNTRELLRWFTSGQQDELLSTNHIAGLEPQMIRAAQVLKDYEKVFVQFDEIYSHGRGEIDMTVSNILETARQLNDEKDR